MRKTTPPGQSLQPAAIRTDRFIGDGDFSGLYEELRALPDADTLLIVGHQGVLSLLTALLLQMPAAAMWHFPIAHGAWSLLEIRDDFTTLRVLNSQAVWRPQEEFPPDH